MQIVTLFITVALTCRLSPMQFQRPDAVEYASRLSQNLFNFNSYAPFTREVAEPWYAHKLRVATVQPATQIADPVLSRRLDPPDCGTNKPPPPPRPRPRPPPPWTTTTTTTLCWEFKADQCCTKFGQLANLVNLAHLGGRHDSTLSW